MSQLAAEQRSKKRKLAAAADVAAAVGEPSTKRSKKDKDAKRVVKAKAKPDKGKSRATDDAFRVVHATLSVAVPPVFAADLRGGVEEMLDSTLMRYAHLIHKLIRLIEYEVCPVASAVVCLQVYPRAARRSTRARPPGVPGHSRYHQSRLPIHHMQSHVRRDSLEPPSGDETR